ncbi:SLC9A1 [Lepeophtheirus salmonis]|uniref:SLC9A1 n=1 Tax=Lepeophtheirus salmonis TaxID=72036 RepID=A0A7R8CWK4_LEPSM|nr:SLC9A1 [Lepeophtheirus salmonis]CAF2954132.1 SLC9A1 [Lepeophtheirus salmonis]
MDCHLPLLNNVVDKGTEVVGPVVGGCVPCIDVKERVNNYYSHTQPLSLHFRCIKKSKMLRQRNKTHSFSTSEKTLIFVNPQSGTKKALQIFQNQLQPQLHVANVEVVYTKFSGDCMDFVKYMKTEDVRGIITVSGDGLLFEVLNGIYQRSDWSVVLDSLIIGVVPGGSCNALSCSLSRKRGIPYLKDFGLCGALANVTRHSSNQSLDLLEIQLEEDKIKVLSFIGVTIGLIADVDIGTEWLRCIGYLRAYFMAAWRILRPRCYKAKLSYLPLERNSETGKPIPSPPNSKIQMPCFGTPELPEGWLSETEKYHMIYAENIPLLDPITLLAPESDLADGIIWLVLVREGMSRWEMIDWFINTDNGKHIGKPGVELNTHGESFTFGNVQGQILPSKVKLMLQTETLNHLTMRFVASLISLNIVCYLISSCNGLEVSGNETEYLNGSSFHHSNESGHEGGSHGVALASWRWDEYAATILFTLMIILAAAFKIAFHHIPVIPNYVPESCVLIILGCLAGGIINSGSIFTEAHPFPKFTSNLFFNVLLPPVILDSAFSLYDRDFISNLGPVLLFAIIGTLVNIFVIGFILSALFVGGLMGDATFLSPFECLIFSSLIAAVDPVAVLAIFERIGVNMSLYFLVFGESLLNDGVTVVIYNTMKALDEQQGNIAVQDYIIAVMSFFFVAGAETIHWSGIIALIGCGIVQKRYAFPNSSTKTRTTVKYGIQTLSSVSDAIIFLFLGTVVISKQHDFQWQFVLWTLFLCLGIRFIAVLILSGILNRTKVKPISLKEQFIMAYGGLRGAVGFSLAALISDNKKYKDMVVTTTIIVIFFTVFVQGSTIKLFVNKLHIQKKAKKDRSVGKFVNFKLIDQVMAGVEAITGHVSKYTIMKTLEQFDTNYVKKILINKGSLDVMERKLQAATMDEHYARLYGPAVLVSESKLGTICKDQTYRETIESSSNDSFDPERAEKPCDQDEFNKAFNSTPFQLYKRRFNRKGDSSDDLIKQLDNNKRTASLIGSRIVDDEKRKIILNRSVSADLDKTVFNKKIAARMRWGDAGSKFASMALIKREYDHAKTKFKK